MGGIDGVRGVAIAAVVLYHLSPDLLPGGFLGVEVFFVLSGYLLTSLALEEHSRRGSIDWRRYGVRRARRILPALLLLLVALVVLGPLVARDDAHRLRSDVPWSAVGMTNWLLIRDGASYFSQLGRPPLVRHLWSLAVEIQLYACVPLLVGWVVRRKEQVARWAVAGGIGASTLLMQVLHQQGADAHAYYGTDARAGALLTGVLVALVLNGRPSPARAGGPTWASIAGGTGLLSLAFLFLALDDGSAALHPMGFLVCRLATAGLLVAARTSGLTGRILAARPLQWLGVRSYGIYLWHWPVIAVLRPGIDLPWSGPVPALVAGAIGLGLGHLSYELVEQRFSHRRRAHRTVPAPVAIRLASGYAAVCGAAAVLLLFANLPAVDPIAKSIREGELLLASQALGTAGGPVVGAAPAPTTGAPASASSTQKPGRTRPPKARVAAVASPEPPPQPLLTLGPGLVPAYPVTSVGDSVMLGAAPQLSGRLGAAAHIDAKVSRQFVEGIDLLRQLRDEGRLGDAVIVHLGTNGPPRASDVDALMEVLAPVRAVVLVTVRVNRKWEAETNGVLADAGRRHPKIALADWYGVSAGHRDWFRSDGTHLTPAGAQAYADLLGSAVPAPAPTPPPPEQPPPTTAPAPAPTTTTTAPGLPTSTP